MALHIGAPDWIGAALSAAGPPRADIYLIGTGHQIPHDLTVGAIAALGRCRSVFGLPPADSPLLPSMVDLRRHYAADVPRTLTYQNMAAEVIDAAITAGPVAFVTFGSAMTGVRPAHLLLELAPPAGLTVHALGGVSFLDGIWSLLNRDPFDGFLIWDATLFLHVKAQPPTRADLLLVQAPFLNLTNALPRTQDRVDVTPLRDHLLATYPADHQVAAVLVSTAGAPARVEWTSLTDLTSLALDLSSLFVPRLLDR